jgi:hypothetical protein
VPSGFQFVIHVENLTREELRISKFEIERPQSETAMSDIAICVEHLSKQYPSTGLPSTALRAGRAGRIGGPQARYKTIRESLTEAVQAPFRRLSSVVRGQSSAVSDETIWALDVSFEASS